MDKIAGAQKVTLDSHYTEVYSSTDLQLWIKSWYVIASPFDSARTPCSRNIHGMVRPNTPIGALHMQ